MRKISLIMLAILFSTFAFSQKDGKEFPPQVINDFKAKFPSATKIKWNKDKEKIEAQFVNDDTKMKIEYLNNAWKKTSYTFKIDYTPQKIKDYVNQYYALYQVKEVNFTDNNLGERLYEVEIAKKKKDRIILIFDISSNFLRLENQK